MIKTQSLAGFRNWLKVATLVAVFLLPLHSHGADPWEMAYAAKEQILLGNRHGAEKLLRKLHEQLQYKDKGELDWELFKWADEELAKYNQNTHGQEVEADFPHLSEGRLSNPPAKPWYRSHWLWIGGGAVLALWLNHEIKKPGPQKTVEGFEP